MSDILNLQTLELETPLVSPALSISSCDSGSC